MSAASRHRAGLCYPFAVIAFRSPLLVLACIAMLVMRLGGVHQHFCLDGSEAPSALHFVDAGLHHLGSDDGHGHRHHRQDLGSQHLADDGHHDDVEVPVANDALTKLASLDLTALAILVIATFVLSPAGRRIRLGTRLAARLPRLPPHLRPPLRGPPHFFCA